MRLHTIVVATNVAAIAAITIIVALLLVRPERRIFVRGFVLMGVGFIGALLRETLVPSDYLVPAQLVYVPIGILGFVLIVRAWRRT